MADRNNFHALRSGFNLFSAAFFDEVEDAKFIKPQFPWSDRVGLERLLPLCLNFGVNLQMSNDPSCNDALIVCFEVRNVIFRVFR